MFLSGIYLRVPVRSRVSNLWFQDSSQSWPSGACWAFDQDVGRVKEFGLVVAG